MANETDDTDRILDAALDLAGERGWRQLTMGEIAAASNRSMAGLYRQFPSKHALLEALGRRVDMIMLDGGETEPEEPPRDRLFDVLMRRFDALNARRGGYLAILNDMERDPLLSLSQLPSLDRSMRWALDLAGMPVQGVVGEAKVRALGIVYALVLRVWMRDDSPDMSRTMAALDQRLSQAEQLANTVERPSRRRDGPDGGTAEGMAPGGSADAEEHA